MEFIFAVLYNKSKYFQDDGLWLLYESAMAFFPLDFSRFMAMTAALASATLDSAARVSGSRNRASDNLSFLTVKTRKENERKKKDCR